MLDQLSWWDVGILYVAVFVIFAILRFSNAEQMKRNALLLFVAAALIVVVIGKVVPFIHDALAHEVKISQVLGIVIFGTLWVFFSISRKTMLNQAGTASAPEP